MLRRNEDAKWGLNITMEFTTDHILSHNFTGLSLRGEDFRSSSSYSPSSDGVAMVNN